MMKKKIWDITTLLVCVGMSIWIISDIYGGMMIWFFSYSMVILLFLIIYIISFFETCASSLIKGVQANKLKVVSHLLVIATFISVTLYSSELFRSKVVLSGVMKDDLFHYRLKFRENGVVDHEINGMFGYQKVTRGRYHFDKDRIVLDEVPYDLDVSSLPDTLCIDHQLGVIFIDQKNANSNKKIEWLNHYNIEE